MFDLPNYAGLKPQGFKQDDEPPSSGSAPPPSQPAGKDAKKGGGKGAVAAHPASHEIGTLPNDSSDELLSGC